MTGISLTKKIDDLKSSGHADIANLVQASSISLTKMGVPNDHSAIVALCLDISGSMSNNFRDGTVYEIVKRSLAQGIIFDDDGQIDIFTFGERAYYEGEVGVNSFESFAQSLSQKPLEGATYYCKAVNLIVNHYKNDTRGLPVYVIFVTDGSPTNQGTAEKAIKDASGKPIFFQFIGIGDSDYFPGEDDPTEKKGIFGGLFSGLKGSNSNVPSTFEFLSKLDTMSGRVVDNAGFFAVRDPKKLADSKLYDNMLREYPGWLKQIKNKRILG